MIIFQPVLSEPPQCPGHISTGPRTIFPARGLPWILETVGLSCEFNFCGVCGHIFYDVRAVPFENWKSLIVYKRP